MRYVSLFSGIEAASAAWEPLGWEALAFAEMDPFASAVLAHRYPETPNLGDVTKVDWHEFRKANGHVDVLVFGSPCQSFSVAGKRLGLDDPRGNLALFALGVVDALRPDWFLFENVPGLLSSGDGRDFGAFLGTVDELGYGWAYRTLDAQFTRAPGYPRAVPQRRRRVFVVGNSRSWTRAAAVLFEPESLSWNSPPSRETGERVAPTISSRPTGGGGLGTDFDCDGGLIPSVSRPLLAKGNDSFDDTLQSYIASTGDVSHCLNAGGMGRIDYETETMIAHALRGEGFDASEDGTGRGTPIVPIAFPARMSATQYASAENISPSLGALNPTAVAFDTTQITSLANRSNPQPGDPCHPLAAGAHAPAVAFNITPSNSNKDFNAREASYAQAVTTQGGAPSARGGDVITSGWAVRRLTPRECERLQGFPDDYTLIPWRKGMAADGPRYKALGNSMAVNVMAWIGHRIQFVSEQSTLLTRPDAA